MSRATISLLSWNGEKYLKNCLNSILAQSQRDFDVFILDNASSDKSCEIIEKFLPIFYEKKIKCEFEKNNENKGFARGHNIIIKKTKNNYILVLNQDIILDKNFLKNLMNFMDKNLEYGSCSGVSFQLTKGKKTDTVDSAGLRKLNHFQFAEIKEAPKNQKKNVLGVSAEAALYRKNALEQIRDVYGDYFDSDFFSYKEDIDLALRLKKAGYKSAVIAYSTCWHARGAQGTGANSISIFKNRKKKSHFINYHSYKNHWFLIFKNLTLEEFIFHSPFIIWYEFKKLLYLLFFEQKTLLAFKEILKKFPKMIRKKYDYNKTANQ